MTRAVLDLFDSSRLQNVRFALPPGYELDLDLADITAFENRLSEPKIIKALSVDVTRDYMEKIQWRLRTRHAYGRRENYIIAIIGPPGKGKTFILLGLVYKLCEWYKTFGVWNDHGWPQEEQCFSLKRNFVQDYLDFIARKEFYLRFGNILGFDDTPEYREEDKKDFVRQAIHAATEATRRLRGAEMSFVFANTDDTLIPKKTIKELFIPLAINPGKSCLALLFRNIGGELVPAGRMEFGNPREFIKRPFAEMDGPELLDVLEGRGDSGQKGAMMRRVAGLEVRRPAAEKLLEILKASPPALVQHHIWSAKSRLTFVRSRLGDRFEPGILDGVNALWRELLQTTGNIRHDGKTDSLALAQDFPRRQGQMLEILALYAAGMDMDQAVTKVMGLHMEPPEKREEPRRVAPAEEPRKVASAEELEKML